MRCSTIIIEDPRKRSIIKGDAQQGTLEFYGGFAYQIASAELAPVVQWIKVLPENCPGKKLLITFKLVFVSKGIKKIWFSLIKDIDKLVAEHGFEVNINWHYDEGEEEYEEDGEYIRDYYAKNCVVNLFEEEDIEKTYELPY